MELEINEKKKAGKKHKYVDTEQHATEQLLDQKNLKTKSSQRGKVVNEPD